MSISKFAYPGGEACPVVVYNKEGEVQQRINFKRPVAAYGAKGKVFCDSCVCSGSLYVVLLVLVEDEAKFLAEACHGSVVGNHQIVLFGRGVSELLFVAFGYSDLHLDVRIL